ASTTPSNSRRSTPSMIGSGPEHGPSRRPSPPRSASSRTSNHPPGLSPEGGRSIAHGRTHERAQWMYPNGSPLALFWCRCPLLAVASKPRTPLCVVQGMIRPALTLKIVRYRSGMRQAPHAHDELHLSIVLRGTVSETVAGRTEVLGPLSLVSKDPGVEHAN